jgi:hypothetical protein
MMIKSIRFCYRKIINADAPTAWERLIFEDSYTEFKMQAQRFNQENKYSSFADILYNNAAAEQLHFLTCAAATGYIKQLNHKIPDVQNTLGKTFLPFSNFRFEIINSDVKDILKHRVPVNFYSDVVTWVETIGGTMVLSLNNTVEAGELLTESFVLPPFVSIYAIKQTD